MDFQKYRFLLPILGGVLVALSLDFPYVWWMSFLGLVPLLFFIEKTVSVRDAFWGGCLAGFVLIGGTFIWFWQTLPLSWLGVDNPFLGILYVLISWGAVSLVLGSSVGIWSVVTRWLLSRNAKLSLILIPFLWILCEYLRTWFFSALTYGEGTVFGPHFTVGFIGYALAEHPWLLQLAAVGNIYVLSFVLVVANVFAWQAIKKYTSRQAFYLCAVVFVGIVGMSFVPYSVKSTGQTRSLSLAALHTDFPPSLILPLDELEKRHQVYRELLSEIAQSAAPDIVILPEDTRFFSELVRTGDSDSYIHSLFTRPVFIVDSARVGDEEKNPKQRIFYLDSAGTVATRDKLFLVPQGEYVPKLFTLIMAMVGISTEKVEAYRTYHPGKEVVAGRTPQSVLVGGLFCSEIFSPSLYASVKKEGAHLLVNVASHAWFHHSEMLTHQVRAAAKVRAVETRLPFIVAANASPSFALDSYGRTLGEIEGGDSILFVQVEIPLI